MYLFLTLLALPLAATLLFPLILHAVYRAPRVVERTTPAQRRLPFEEQRLPGPRGKRLFAWRLPRPDSHTTLVVVHGWGANAEMMLPLAAPFHRAGLEVLLYDARNHGRSDGDSFSSLPRFAEDLEAVLAWLRRERPTHRQVVLGHSIGAAAAILSASRRRDIDLLIAVSAFAHPRLVMSRHLDRPWLPRFLRPLIMGYIQWVIGSRFDDIAPMNRIAQVRCPLLLAHGSDDRTVPISDMRLIEAHAPASAPVEVLAVAGAQHDSVDRFEEHADRLITFIETHLGRLPAGTPQAGPEPSRAPAEP